MWTTIDGEYKRALPRGESAISTSTHDALDYEYGGQGHRIDYNTRNHRRGGTSVANVSRVIPILHQSRLCAVVPCDRSVNRFGVSDSGVYNPAGKDFLVVRFVLLGRHNGQGTPTTSHELCHWSMCCWGGGVGLRMGTYVDVVGVWREYRQEDSRTDIEGSVEEDDDVV